MTCPSRTKQRHLNELVESEVFEIFRLSFGRQCSDGVERRVLPQAEIQLHLKRYPTCEECVADPVCGFCATDGICAEGDESGGSEVVWQVLWSLADVERKFFEESRRDPEKGWLNSCNPVCNLEVWSFVRCYVCGVGRGSILASHAWKRRGRMDSGVCSSEFSPWALFTRSAFGFGTVEYVILHMLFIFDFPNQFLFLSWTQAVQDITAINANKPLPTVIRL